MARLGSAKQLPCSKLKPDTALRSIRKLTRWFTPPPSARIKLGEIFAKVIQARRAATTKEEDVLQQFCDARYQVGSVCRPPISTVPASGNPHLAASSSRPPACLPAACSLQACNTGLAHCFAHYNSPTNPTNPPQTQNVEGGRQLTEEEITGLLIAVLFAGQHTSSITSSWTGIFMIDSKVGRVSREASALARLHLPSLGVR